MYYILIMFQKCNDIPILYENISFSYDQKPLINCFSYKLEKGKHTCICGKIGRGKSSLLKLACGLISPLSGKIEIFGNDISNSDFEFRSKIGYVFQDPKLQIIHPLLLEDVAFTPRNLMNSISESNVLALKALQKLDLLQYENKNLSELSGGEMQMIAFAGAITHEPEILLLDEPTSMLDDKNKETICSYLKNATLSGISILSVSHDKDFLKIVDEIIDLS